MDFTLNELFEIMRASAGEDESVSLDGTVLDREFSELGYDSVTLLEITSRVERELDVVLDDSVVFEATTPRVLLAAIDSALQSRAG
ncbi:acyl carrier protein [Kitasatospora sp. NBC_01302]|uniref:acyl carrier protein n=1 Tax=Kitasatospora sp. NBC_01302 TaxID=2903575 RepID=UPI002E0F5794|nr:acyl carrier protein [Kitasatospora sp. NBC_01302]